MTVKELFNTNGVKLVNLANVDYCFLITSENKVINNVEQFNVLFGKHYLTDEQLDMKVLSYDVCLASEKKFENVLCCVSENEQRFLSTVNSDASVLIICVTKE